MSPASMVWSQIYKVRLWWNHCHQVLVTLIQRLRPIYTPLDVRKEQIRILIIHPDPNPEAVPCLTFKTVSLKDKPKFVALSYRWGESAPRTPVLLNGRNTTVTVSLGTALRQFRADSGDRPLELWADALCINQNDLAEKSQQVNLMKKLYSQATEVRIWLGPADPDTKAAFRCLRRVLSQDWQTPFVESNDTNLDALAILDSEAAYKEVHDALAALASLFRNAYWTRRWTLQEMLLAQLRTLHCGCWSVPWSFEGVLKFFVCLRGVQAQGITDEGFWRALGDICPPVFTLLNKVAATTDYKQFLLDTKANECFLPHDIVYAVLGVLPPDLKIEADYKKPIDQVLADYVYRLITEVDHIDILYQLRTADAKLPSWVPELRAEILKQERRWFPPSDTPSHRSLQSQLYQCSAGATAKPSIQQCKTLKLQGLHLDTVVAIGTELRDDESTHLSNPRLISSHLPVDWWNLYSSHCLPQSNNITDEDIEDALFRVYHLDQMSGLAHEYAKTHSRGESARLTDADIAACRDNVYAAHPLGNPSLMTFFVTKHGRAGMTHSEAHVGDSIFAIAGLDMPLCLREAHADGAQAWEKIAVCYLHGIMDGEAVLSAAGGDSDRVQEVLEEILLV